MLAERQRQKLQSMADEYKAAVIEEKLRRLREKGEERPMDMETVERVILFLKAMGLKVVPAKGGGLAADEDGWMGVVRDALRSPVGAAVAATMLQAMGGSVQFAPPAESAPPEAPPPPQLPQNTQSAPPQEDQMSIIARLAISQLKGKEPAEAARFLMGVDHPQVRGIVQQLVQTPDAQLPALFAQMRVQNPGFGLFIDWLHGQPEWTVNTIRALRALVAPPQAMGF